MQKNIQLTDIIAFIDLIFPVNPQLSAWRLTLGTIYQDRLVVAIEI